MAEVQWQLQETARQLIRWFRQWWLGLWSGYAQQSTTNGPIEAGVTMTSLQSEPKSQECVSSSTELKVETSCPEASLIGPLQDSKIESATSSGASSPVHVQKTVLVDRHGTLALILASAACGAIFLGSVWMPYMLTASQEKGNARAQQAITTAELAKRDLEDMKRELQFFKETGRWAEK